MITTRIMDREDIPFLTAISKDEIDGFMDSSDFESFTGSRDDMCIVAEDDGAPAGMMVLKVFGPEMEPVELRLPDCPERDLVLSCKRIAYIDALAVSSDHQGRGIGTVLCNKALEVALDRGCDIICAMASKYITGVTNAEGVFRRMGMAEGIELKGYWNMLVPGISCRYCDGPCRCSGVFWHLRL